MRFLNIKKKIALIIAFLCLELNASERIFVAKDTLSTVLALNKIIGFSYTSDQKAIQVFVESGSTHHERVPRILLNYRRLRRGETPLSDYKRLKKAFENLK